jgi:SAM-dependent methyltransferase
MNPYIRLPKVCVLRGRYDFILERCRGKRVLHVGCVDSGQLAERFRRGELIHQRLAVSAGELWGVDIDAEGISFLRDNGFENLIVGDASEIDQIEVLTKRDFDIVLASEIIEHLQNPGQFLRNIRAVMRPNRTELIATVPNAHRIDTLFWLLRGIEYVHPDHNYWFSYQTATNLLGKSGLKVEEVYVYSFRPHRIIPDFVKGILTKGDQSHEPPPGRPAKLPEASLSGIPLVREGLRYIGSFPVRVLLSLLYRRTAFFGDGIILVAKV